jgi:hypothetical protein
VRSSLRSFEGRTASLVFKVLPAFAPERADLKRFAQAKLIVAKLIVRLSSQYFESRAMAPATH